MTPDHEEYKQNSFEAYCKKILKHTAVDLQRQLKRLGEREVSLSGLPESELMKLSVTDNYFADEYAFPVLGESVGVSDYELGAALNALPADRREIVLMSYFFDMTDREIAERLNMARSTVSYRRISSLRLLKNILESED